MRRNPSKVAFFTQRRNGYKRQVTSVRVHFAPGWAHPFVSCQFAGWGEWRRELLSARERIDDFQTVASAAEATAATAATASAPMYL